MKYKVFAASCGVPMTTALDQDGCELVQDFFRALIGAANHGTVNVGNALKLYRETYGAFCKHDSLSAADGRKRASQKWADRYRDRSDWVDRHNLPNGEAADLAMVEWGIKRDAAYQWIRLYRERTKH